MTNHSHLRTVIEDIYSNANDNLTFKLANEFRYSNLFIAARREGGSLNFITYQYDDLKITPLFTDRFEFGKFFSDDDVIMLQNSFELYRNILKTTDIDGYVLNPASENYLFEREFVLSITNIPKTSFYVGNPYSEDELRRIHETIDNSVLEAFISNPSNVADYEALAEMMSNSRLLALMLSDLNIDDDIISLKNTGPIAQIYTDRIGGVYACLFTSQDKMSCIKTDKCMYSQLIDLATMVNFILFEDMDGLIINPESDNVLVPRSVLLKYSLGFERYANDPRLSEAMYYMFKKI